MNIYPARKTTSKLQHRTGKPLLWLFALLCLNSTLANELQNHDAIHRAVKEFAGDVAIQEIDPRLRLEACAENISVRYPFSTETTVEVKCTADKGWKIFLTITKPISEPNVSPPAKQTQEKTPPTVEMLNGVVTKRTLQRGIPIRDSDIELKSFPSNRLQSGHVKSLTYPIGMEPSQTIPKGALISINMLRPQVLVRKGDAVSIIFERNGISVTNEGIALENGGLREKIKIQLPDTKKILSATIQSPGVVKIP
jgi:flagella basal body P-ring formation protein FlgA